MRNAECAIITTRITPKYRVRPAARRAYSPPSSTPRIRLWNSRLPEITWSPVRLGVDEVRFLGLGRQHDLDLAVDVLLDHVRALWPAGLVPAERPHHGLDRVLAQPLHQLLLALALLGAAHRLDGRGDDLPGGVRVRLVLARHGAEHLLVLGDELDVARVAGLVGVAGGRQ